MQLSVKRIVSLVVIGGLLLSGVLVAKPMKSSKKISKQPQQHSVLSSIFGGHYAFAYNGYDLFINGSSINTDAHLLSIDQHNPQQSSLLISGALQALLTHTFDANPVSQLGLTFLEFQSYATVNHWAHFFLDTLVNPSNVQFMYPRYFMTLGNFNVSKWYLSFGKMYVPFGLFNTSVINVLPEISEQLGGIHANAISLGWGAPTDKLSMQAYVYQSNVNINHKKRYEGGVNVIKQMIIARKHVTAGLSLVSNIIDSNALSVPFMKQGDLAAAVAGVDARSIIMFPHNMQLSVEYLSALKHVTLASQAIMPSGWHVEMVKRAVYRTKPISLAFGLDQTKQSALFQLPKYRYYGAFSITPIKHSVITFELNDDINYQTHHNIMGYVLFGYYF